MKLLDFVGGVVDFGALASATNLSNMLAQDGCLHMKDVKERHLEGSADLGMTSRNIRRSIRHFMKSFWVRFGQVEARSMAEAHRAKVSFSFVTCMFLSYVFTSCLLFL